MQPEEWRQQGSFFTYQTDQIFYIEAGQGSPLLLLHAYPTASWGFHRIWAALAQQFHVIALDLLGSGFSDKPRGKVYSIFNLADSVEALLKDRLKDHTSPQIHILAHAYGVTTAQELLARQLDPCYKAPFKIGSICFINGGLFPEATRPTPTQKLLLTPIGSTLVRVTPYPYRVFCDKLSRNFGPHTQPTDQDLQAIWQLLTYQEGHRVVPEVLAYLKERVQYRDRWVGALQSSPIPLCLVNGAADPVSGQEVPIYWQRYCPQFDLVQLEATIGHYPPLEDPQGVLKAYQAFQSRLV